MSALMILLLSTTSALAEVVNVELSSPSGEIAVVSIETTEVTVDEISTERVTIFKTVDTLGFVSFYNYFNNLYDSDKIRIGVKEPFQIFYITAEVIEIDNMDFSDFTFLIGIEFLEVDSGVIFTVSSVSYPGREDNDCDDDCNDHEDDDSHSCGHGNAYAYAYGHEKEKNKNYKKGKNHKKRKK